MITEKSSKAVATLNSGRRVRRSAKIALQISQEAKRLGTHALRQHCAALIFNLLRGLRHFRKACTRLRLLTLAVDFGYVLGEL